MRVEGAITAIVATGAGTLNAAARTRVIHCRRTDTALPVATPAAWPRNAEPTIKIRGLRIFSARSSDTGTGLKFHTVHDANVALHALADAQEAFQSTFGPDPASAVPGADIVVVYRALYTTVYRLDHLGAAGFSARGACLTTTWAHHRAAPPLQLRDPIPAPAAPPATPPIVRAASGGHRRESLCDRHRAMRRMLSPWSPITTCRRGASAPQTFTHSGVSHSCSPNSSGPRGAASRQRASQGVAVWPHADPAAPAIDVGLVGRDI